jgi:hypothetical protein
MWFISITFRGEKFTIIIQYGTIYRNKCGELQIVKNPYLEWWTFVFCEHPSRSVPCCRSTASFFKPLAPSPPLTTLDSTPLDTTHT